MQPTTAALVLISAALGSGCALPTAQPHEPRSTERELTPGIVQREVHEGTEAARVAEALGSPNIVTRDERGREVWIYDRISTERVEKARSANVFGAGMGPVGSWLGVAGAGGSQSQRELSTTQKTLTVVVRFDEQARVMSVSFHASRF
jgi:hypothetical protein